MDTSKRAGPTNDWGEVAPEFPNEPPVSIARNEVYEKKLSGERLKDGTFNRSCMKLESPHGSERFGFIQVMR